MAINTLISEVTLDVYDHDTTPQIIKTIALDNKTRFIHAYLQSHGTDIYQPDRSAKITLTALRPDKVAAEVIGSVIELIPAGEDHEEYQEDEQGNSSTVIVPGDPAVYGLRAEITQAMIAVQGTVLFQFKMESGKEVLRTEIFKADNGRALDADVSEWADEYQGYNLDELVKKTDFMGTLIDQALEGTIPLDRAILETHRYTERYINGRLNVENNGIHINTQGAEGGDEGDDERVWICDNTLTVAGAAADAKTVGDKIEELNAGLSVEDAKFSLINYGYDVPFDRDGDPSSTNSNMLGIKRRKRLVTLTCDKITPRYMFVRITGDIRATVQTSTVETWPAELVLETGKRYSVKRKLVSGTEDDDVNKRVRVSVYPTGTHNTVGSSTWHDDVYVRSFNADASAYNIALYIPADCNLPGNTYAVWLEEVVTEDDPLETLVLNEHSLINYNYDVRSESDPTIGATDASQIGIYRNKSVLRLTCGNEQVSTNVMVRLSGTPTRVALSSAVESWSAGVFLEPGATYKIRRKLISGTEGTPRVSISVYRVGEHNSVGTTAWDGNTFTRTFIADTYGYNIVCYIPKNTVLDPTATYLITLEKVPAFDPEAPEFFEEEMAETLDSVRKCQTEPCLVFPLITDIHYGSDTCEGNKWIFTEDTIKNLKRFVGEVNCDGVICLGDITDGGYHSNYPSSVSNTALVGSMLLNTLRELGVPLYFTMGNHDDSRYFSSSWMTIEQIYATYMSQSCKNVIFDMNYYGLNYYADFESFGVRLISIDTNKVPTSSGAGAYGFSDQTVAFLTSSLASMDSSWMAVVITHAPIFGKLLKEGSSAINGSANVQNAIRNSGKTVAIFSGHTHYDVFDVDEFIHTVTAANKVSLRTEDLDIELTGNELGRVYIRQTNTKTEDLWEAIVLRPFSRILDLVRFGSGVNRRFHITPVAPTTLTTYLTGTITWRSTNTAVATVSNGIVTSMAAGRCGIVATDENGNFECWPVVVF